MTQRYDQPFCIRGSKGKFAACYEERGYLPALESFEQQAEQDQAEIELRFRDMQWQENPTPVHTEIDRTFAKWSEDEGELAKKLPPHKRPIKKHGLNDRVEQLEGYTKYLEGKFNEHVDSSKRRKKGSW